MTFNSELPDRLHKSTHLVLALVALLCLPATVEAVTLVAGDIVVALDGNGDGSQNAILKVDPITGDRTVISQPSIVGSGPDFGSMLIGVTFDPAGDLLVAGLDGSAVFRVDVETGNRTIVSGPAVGTGAPLQSAGYVQVAPDGTIFTTTSTGLVNSGTIVQIDPATGNRQLVSGAARGAGPVFRSPGGLSLTPAGDFYVSDSGDPDTVWFVDGASGDRTIVSGGSVGAGPGISPFSQNVVAMENGDLFVADLNDYLLRIDSSTGLRSIVAAEGTGSGPPITDVTHVSAAVGGKILASTLAGIFIVDPLTSERFLISSANRGTGLSNGFFRQSIQVVPEPSAFALGLLGATMGLIYGCRTRKRRRR